QHCSFIGVEIIFYHHDLDIPVDSRNANGVISLGADDSGYGGSVRATRNVVSVGIRVPAEVIVSVAVIIIIDVVTRNFAVIDPKIVFKVLVAKIDPAIQNCRDERVAIGGKASGGDIPGEVGVDVCIDDAA